MGLDMMLSTNDNLFQNGSKNVIYWRKANAIHQWFVDHVQNGCDDCGTYTVGRQHLVELYETVGKILEDRSLANELLPTQPGFFFGSTKYDEYYFEELTDTYRKLHEVLQAGLTEFVYRSSW